MKESQKFWDTIGIISFLLLATKLIQKINEDTSTKLYDEKALKDLEDRKRFKEIYGRSKDADPVSVHG